MKPLRDFITLIILSIVDNREKGLLIHSQSMVKENISKSAKVAHSQNQWKDYCILKEKHCRALLCLYGKTKEAGELAWKRNICLIRSYQKRFLFKNVWVASTESQISCRNTFNYTIWSHICTIICEILPLEFLTFRT